MKILFVTEFFPYSNELIFSGGVEAYNFYLISELSKKHQISVICRNQGSGNLKPRFNFKIIRIGHKSIRIDTDISTLPYRLSFFIQALRLGLREDFDIVQGNNFVTYPIAFLLGVLKKRPAIAWYPDVFIGKWIKLTGLLPGVIGEIVERISLVLPWAHVIALSGETKYKLLRLGIDDKNISLIYAGIDLVFFKKIKIRKNKILTLCCVSRLVRYKRIDLLIKAASVLKIKGYKFKVYIVGNGPEKNNLINLREELGLESFVVFESDLSRIELGKRIKSSHLFCHLSEAEGFGMVLLEAAACGVPIVASNLRILREITQNGKGTIFFEPGNYNNLAKKIEQIIKNKKFRQELSKDVFNLAAAYSWTKITKDFETIYFKLTTKKIKILMLIDAWFPYVGGGQIHVWELSKQLAKIGCEITIFTRDLGRWNEFSDGVRVIKVGFSKKFANIFGRIEYLIYALIYSLSAKYDILHAHAFSPGLIAPFVKILRNKPVVYTVHGKGAKIAGLGFGEKFLENLVTYKIPYNLEITVAKNTITKKTSAKKLVVVPNGVDIEKFATARRKRTKIKKILYVGRLSYEKGVDILIEAFKGLKSKKLSLSMVGEGGEYEKLKKMAREVNINFLGKLTSHHLISEYKKADLLVLPSRTEGQPLVLFEAWAAKLPILVTRVGDNEKYIKDGVNGYLTYPDVKSLTMSINKIFDIKDIGEVTNKAYLRVQKFSWNNIAYKTLGGYNQLLYGEAQN